MKNTIKDIDLKGKRVLLRVDFNCPQFEDGKVSDATRINEALPTIKYILEQGAKLIICSHLGRPKGIDAKFSLKPVIAKFSELLGKPVAFADDVAGPDSIKKAKALKAGEVLVLENLRFEKGEEANDPDFAKKLASLADIYVNDAFGTAHRAHASTYGVPQLLPNAVGFLMGKEAEIIGKAVENPARPFVAIIGGSKIKDKIAVINNLIDVVDTMLIGGGLAYTFIKANGGKIGTSICDDESLQLAKDLMAKAKKKGIKFVLPVDTGCATEFKMEAKRVEFPSDKIPDNYGGFDIGKKTIELFKKELKNAKTVTLNGILGVFEFDNFQLGTKEIAEAIASLKGATTIIGGGDSAAAIVKYGCADKVTHISTGGGASLALLEGEKLPYVEIMSEKK
ncbi:phosphoglycerate kinase [Holotrichia oblita]|nr:phosphoglycerate kinase [Holotrichia oblita]